jgi:glycosyltransferase involved in cell wall biosynthesis
MRLSINQPSTLPSTLYENIPHWSAGTLSKSTGDRSVEVSVVIPCLNEADTIGVCVQKAMAALVGAHIAGEVIAADNGSTDGSDRIAKEFGARVIHVSGKGYGKALMAGIAAASGRYIIMGDADDSYDFSELPRFVARLREGFELVQGCRLPAGGGTIARGAMRWSHRIGNPLLSFLARFMFKVPAKDIYCGFRGFTKHLYSRIEQRCHGMEFATEMLIKATLHNARISELPITLHRDGRTRRRSHLRTYRDGWRTLRFFLLCSPRWLFLLPGLLLITVGLLAAISGLANLHFHNITFDAHNSLWKSRGGLRASMRPFCRLREDVCDSGANLARGQVFPSGREQAYLGTWIDRRTNRSANRHQFSRRVGRKVAASRFWANGLPRDDEDRDSRRHFCRPRFSNHPFQFFQQHFDQTALSNATVLRQDVHKSMIGTKPVSE